MIASIGRSKTRPPRIGSPPIGPNVSGVSAVPDGSGLADAEGVAVAVAVAVGVAVGSLVGEAVEVGVGGGGGRRLGTRARGDLGRGRRIVVTVAGDE